MNDIGHSVEGQVMLFYIIDWHNGVEVIFQKQISRATKRRPDIFWSGFIYVRMHGQNNLLLEYIFQMI